MVGLNIRLSHLLEQHEKFMDQTVTVCGWALNAKLQQNDSLLFVSLVDGSNAVPLQVVIENTVADW